MKSLQVAVIPSTRFRLDGGAMFGIVPKALWSKACPPDSENRIPMTTRLVFIETEDRRMLTDPGIGAAWDQAFMERFCIEEPATALEEALSALGTDPGGITDVLLTHLHFDHVGGCFARRDDGSLALRFPRARHHVQTKQWRWAQSPSLKDRGSYIPEHMELLAKVGVLELHDGPWSPATSLSAFPVEGHTPSQQLFRIQSGDRSWIYGGDLFPIESQLRLPWLMAYDIEPLKSLQAKQDCLERHLSRGEFLILGHDAATIGGAIEQGDRYAEIREPLTCADAVHMLSAT